MIRGVSPTRCHRRTGETTGRSAHRRATTALIRTLAFLAIGLICGVTSTSAAQATRIALGVSGGTSVPLSATDRFVPRFEDLATTTATGPTFLVHQRPRTGMNLQVEATIRNMYLRYRFSRAAWAQDRVRCRPADPSSGDATLLPNGEYDDRTMAYDCDGERARMARDPDRRNRHSHSILAGLEFQALDPWRVIPFATIGGGLVLTQYHPESQNSAIRPGIAVQVGGGLLFPVDRNVTIYIETQYNLTLMTRGGNYSLRAGRAVAAGRTVLSAVVDPIHAVDATIGIRFRIR